MVSRKQLAVTALIALGCFGLGMAVSRPPPAPPIPTPSASSTDAPVASGAPAASSPAPRILVDREVLLLPDASLRLDLRFDPDAGPDAESGGSAP